MEFTRILNGVASRCLSFGEVSQYSTTSPEYLILVVPGNPGLIEYYRDFMSELYLLLRNHFPSKKISVLGISHGGHQIEGIEAPFPSVSENPQLYDLYGQIKAKEELIRSLLETTKIILIGHSIGCKMLLEVLKTLPEELQARVVKSYMLFPTVERMRETPNGRRLWSILPYYPYGAYLFLPFFLLPGFIQRFLLYLYFFVRSPPPCISNATLQLFNKDVYLRILFLAKTELTFVNELDVDTLKRFCKKIYFYFGTTDGWCPVSYVHGMVDRIPELQYEICSRGFEHAFVIKNSKEMAGVLFPKIKDDIDGSDMQ
ncbi:unnamed protein product [Allacma fusca]|uniref:Lipid droplet-associated hydrolase n=1 Tax=Allacma fusca TaxID=39272 RepID=A0A8J2NR68_9HEXA|nr:unnamed protein product [Allacma fusca]